MYHRIYRSSSSGIASSFIEYINGVKLVGIANQTYQRWNASIAQTAYGNSAEANARQFVPRELTLRFEVGTNGYTKTQGYENLKEYFATMDIFGLKTVYFQIGERNGDVFVIDRQIPCVLVEFSEPRWEDAENTYATAVFQTLGFWESAEKTVTKEFSWDDADVENDTIDFVIPNQTEVNIKCDLEISYTSTVPQSSYPVYLFGSSASGGTAVNQLTVTESGTTPITIKIDGNTLKITAINTSAVWYSVGGLFNITKTGKTIRISFGLGNISILKPVGTITAKFKELYI